MVPATSACGPGLALNVPPLAANTLPVFSGISGDGNIAIIKMNPDGVYSLSDVGVYADIGIEVAAATADAGDDGTNNSFFNDPNEWPNTFDGTTCTFVVGDPAALIDDPVYTGVTANVDFTALIAELLAAKTVIPALLDPTILDVTMGLGTGGQGVIQDIPYTINLVAGLNVIDVDTAGADFVLNYI